MHRRRPEQAHRGFTLDLGSCWGLSELDGIGECAELREINLYGCSKLADISALIGCKKLREVDLSYCIAVGDVTVFDDLEELKKVIVPERLDDTDDLLGLQTRETAAGAPAVKVLFK